MMNAETLVDKSLDYIVMFSPYLLIFFSIAFAYKMIDLIFYSIDRYRRGR